MGRRQICFMVDEETLEEFEQVKDKTGLPVARQVELKLMGYSIVEENEKTAIQLLEGTVECLKMVGNKGETYDDIIKRLVRNLPLIKHYRKARPELKDELSD